MEVTCKECKGVGYFYEFPFKCRKVKGGIFCCDGECPANMHIEIKCKICGGAGSLFDGIRYIRID